MYYFMYVVFEFAIEFEARKRDDNNNNNNTND